MGRTHIHTVQRTPYTWLIARKELTTHMEKDLKQEINTAFENKPQGGNRVYALMLFYTELELGISQKPNVWLNFGNQYYESGSQALEAYANTPCPASQLIDAQDKDELLVKMNDMLHNFNNPKWLEENLYPTL